MYICKYEILAHFNLAVAKVDRQTAKFNSPPNFPAIRYMMCLFVHSVVLVVQRTASQVWIGYTYELSCLIVDARIAMGFLFLLHPYIL